MIVCKNCKQQFDGQFCPSCGQKHIEKFTWQHLKNLFFLSIEMEKGLLLNIKDLTIRPTQTITQYLTGKTKNYINPVAYFFIILALITFIISMSDNLLYRGFDASSFTTSDKNTYLKNIFIMFFFGAGLNISLSIFNKYTFIENAIISLFITSHVFLFYSLLSIIPNNVFLIISIVVPALYAINIIYKLLKRKILGSIWRLLFILIITFIFSASGMLFYSLSLPYLEKEKVADFKLEYDQKVITTSQLMEGSETLSSMIITSDLKDFQSSTRKFLHQIDIIRNELIVQSGGIDSEGNLIGLRDKTVMNSLLQNMEDSRISVQQEWLIQLAKCDCELVEKDGLISIDNFRYKMMIESMIEFNRIEQTILLTEQQCYINHLKISSEEVISFER